MAGIKSIGSVICALGLGSALLTGIHTPSTATDDGVPQVTQTAAITESVGALLPERDESARQMSVFRSSTAAEAAEAFADGYQSATHTGIPALDRITNAAADIVEAGSGLLESLGDGISKAAGV